jgi:hypothetical protein
LKVELAPYGLARVSGQVAAWRPAPRLLGSARPALRLLDSTPVALWPPIVAAAAFGLLSPLYPIDLFVNLRLGQLALETGEIPLRPLFAHTPVLHEAINAPWLTQLILALVYQAGGLPGLVVLQAGLVALAFTLLLVLCRRRAGIRLGAGAAALLALLLAIPSLGLRPQLFSVALFSCFLLLLERPLGRAALVLLPGLTMLWANLHGGFLLGLLLIGARVAVTALEALVPAGEAYPCARAAVSRVVAASGRPALLLAISAAAACLNPHGPRIYAYAWGVAANPAVRTYVVEWQPPSMGAGGGSLFLIMLSVLGASLALGRPRVRLMDLALLVGFGLLAVQAQRNVIWWGLATAPLLSAGLAGLAARKARVQGHALPAAGSIVVRRGAAFVALALVALALPWWKPSNPLLPVQARALMAAETPVGATEYLAGLEARGNVFNAMSWGGYLAWALWPRHYVFVDNLVETYPIAVWQDYLSISRAEPGWQALLDQYGVEFAVLQRSTQASLIAAMETSQDWQVHWQDERAAVFLRRPLEHSRGTLPPSS